jgi:peptide/nickel transport system substrate-binding protein
MPMSVRAVAVLASLLSSVALVGACGGSSGAAEDAPPTRAGASEPRNGGHLVVGLPSEPDTLNPLFIKDILTRSVTKVVHAALMYPNEHNEMIPLIAASAPEPSAEGSVWTVQLREGVKFHDGMPLTAADVVFTYSVASHPDFAGMYTQMRVLAKAEAVDELTVRFTLSEPSARFPTLLDLDILPKHLLAHVPVKELAEYRAYNVDQPIGAGPFKLVRWTAGQSLELEAFDDYLEGRPHVDRATVRVVSNSGAGVLLLAAGEIDVFSVPQNELATLEAMRGVEVHATPTLNFHHIAWNLRNPLFLDRRVRQALTHAIDREAIVDALLGGHGIVAHAPIPPLIAWAYTDDVPKFAYDPMRARQLLSEAGWAPGADGILQRGGERFAFELLTSENSTIQRDAVVIAQQYLREVGIEVRVTQLELSSLISRIDAPRFEFDAYLLGMNVITDPDPRPLWHSGEIAAGLNNIAFHHPRVDELADLNTRLLDRAERAAVLAEVWKILAEEQPYTFLFFPEALYGVRTDVHGLKAHPRLITHRMNEWWLDRGEAR